MDEIELHHEDEFEVDDETEKGVQRLKEGAKKRKGRGFGKETRMNVDQFESMDVTEVEQEGGPQRSVEGWIVFITNINEEAQEDDIREKFEEFGEIKNLHLNMDRRTGYVKGYALVEYNTFKEAEASIHTLNGTEICGQKIGVDWTFVKGPSSKRGRQRREERRSPVSSRRR